MSDPRLSSPSTIRLVAAAAAAVASLGVVALGVQLGTSGLVGNGPGRNPGSSSATPASATVDLPRSRPTATLEEQLVALVPGVGTTSFGSSPSGGSATTTPAPSDTSSAPAGPGDGGTTPAPGGPVPDSPVPTPEPPATPPPTVPTPPPSPAPTVPPELAPIVEPIDDALSGVTDPPADESGSATEEPAPTAILEGLIRLLLGT